MNTDHPSFTLLNEMRRAAEERDDPTIDDLSPRFYALLNKARAEGFADGWDMAWSWSEQGLHRP